MCHKGLFIFVWFSSKFLPVFLVWWDFCYHPGLSAVESSVLSREYSREMTIPHVLHVPTVEQQKDETLKFYKGMLLTEVCKRRVIFAVSHLYWSSGWKMSKLKTWSAPTQNMQLLCSLILQCCTFPCSLSLLHWVSGFRDASLFLLYCLGGPGFTVPTFECHCGCYCLPSTIQLYISWILTIIASLQNTWKISFWNVS